jgi:hypothetical protein
MGSMEIPGLDIWEKFEDLSLPPFSPNLNFEETSFDDIFNNSLCEKSVYDDSDETLHEAIADLDCSLYNDQLEGESLNIKDDLIFSNSLESSFSCYDSFECENVSTVIIDHPYAQKERSNNENHFILNKSEDKLESEPIDKLFSGKHKKSLEKTSKLKQKQRTNAICQQGYSTKCVENNKFDYKVKSLTNHIILLFNMDF